MQKPSALASILKDISPLLQEPKHTTKILLMTISEDYRKHDYSLSVALHLWKKDILLCTSEDIRLTQSYRRLREETSGKFMMPTVTRTLYSHYTQKKLECFQRLFALEVLNRWVPATLSDLIYDFYFDEEIHKMPVLVEVLESPRVKQLPSWLVDCWKDVRCIIVRKCPTGLQAAQRLRALLEQQRDNENVIDIKSY